jgi:hypothetical protein
VLKWRSGLFERATLQAEPLAMPSKALPVLRQCLRGRVTQSTQ